jgi:uncharacterized cysteine cluster protein YcgN (CxxCxxCC family)
MGKTKGTTKKYEGFWMGRSWVSRCNRCGHICFVVAQEEEHNKEKCVKVKLKLLSAEETDAHNPPKEST